MRKCDPMWYACAGVSVLMIFAALYIGLIKFNMRMRMLFVLLSCIVFAYVIYLPPFLKAYELIPALFGCLINVLQLITLDADYTAFYEVLNNEIGIEFFREFYYVLLGMIHVALPAVSALTAVTVIMKYFARLRIIALKRSGKTLHVFSSIKDESVTFARDIRRQFPRCEILFLDDKEKSNYSDLTQELHCKIIDEKIENIKAYSKNRKVYYYCISKNEEDNLNSCLKIMANLEHEKREVQQNNFVYLFSSDSAAELIVDSLQKGSINIDIIDEHKIAAYNLVTKYPLINYANGDKISVMICGWSGVSEEVLKVVSWCGQLPGFKLKISVIGKEIENYANDFIASHPGLFTERYNINFYSYLNDLEFYSLIKEHMLDSNYIVVSECDDDSKITVERAVSLRRYFYKADPEFSNEPPIFAYIESSQKAKAVEVMQTAEAKAARRMHYNVTPFGMADEIYKFDSITESDLDILSKNVHLVYEDIFSDGPIDVPNALERYNLFEVNKNANRANALHIRYKLLLLGLDYFNETDSEEVDFYEYLTDAALDKLTLAEHDRWMAFLESEGWEGASVEEVFAYQKSGISKGRHNCPLLLLHPYICPFENLKECSNSLGLNDSTIYDIELIKRIPDILYDKWNVSRKTFKIVKKQGD